jgi:hypothetical protein
MPSAAMFVHANQPFCFERLVWIQNPNQYTLRVNTSPSQQPEPAEVRDHRRRQPQHADRQQDLDPFPQQETRKRRLRHTRQQRDTALEVIP